MRHLNISLITLCLALPASFAHADRTDIPQRYFEHGLLEDAKREFIAITFDPKADDEEKAKSLSALGDIAFGEQKVSLALATWQEMIETYPDSDQVEFVMQRIAQIGQLIGANSDETLDNAVARTYIRHGDWWSREKEEKITIDSSWIPNDQVAIGWYDRVIAEFPDTPAAVLALKKKFYTVNGWEEPGKYGETYGVKKTKRVVDLVAVYDELEAVAPDDVDLQRFRYMIAQNYWSNQKWAETREWLQKIIDQDSGKISFYKDLAEWRLKKVEY